MDLQFKVEQQDNITIFTIEDLKVTHNNVPSFKEKVFLEIADGHSAIVLNLKNVEEMDSSGLGALLFAKRQANGAKGEIVLAEVKENIQTMIRIAQLARVFELFDTVEKAVQYFQEQ